MIALINVNCWQVLLFHANATADQYGGHQLKCCGGIAASRLLAIGGSVLVARFAPLEFAASQHFVLESGHAGCLRDPGNVLHIHHGEPFICDHEDIPTGIYHH